MTTKINAGFWKTVRSNVKKRLLAGILLLMPFGVALLVIIWLFHGATGLLRPVVSGIILTLTKSKIVNSIPQPYVNISIWVVTVITLLLLLYTLGTIGQYVVGRKILAAGEVLMLRIPLARTIYTATKQVIKTISLPNREAFKSVVLVEFPRPGFKAIGFLTGRVKTAVDQELCKVFIPTTPNPTTGFFELVPANEVVDTDLTIEEAFKMIISGGIVSPDTLFSHRLNSNQQD